MKLALIGALLLALSFPAYAQDRCVDTVDTASAAMSEADVQFDIIDEPDAVAAFVEYLAVFGAMPGGVTHVTHVTHVTRVFLATAPKTGAVFFGLEISGCLTPPAALPVAKASA